MSTTTETEFTGEDDHTTDVATGLATDAATTTPVIEPPVQPEEPEHPETTHTHEDGTTHFGPMCSGGCPK
ncbi:hypothetical protein JOF56_000319 [Kibdelosporangium banguiense]|uniref:Uncharacterized protein n=1 Tax=Kibdelosporangium banguiense TaxID=1365924 RepID=A0ABS4T643_9PSEU|nr:hypothetical protein [Kibdelosporangium banguiense]MBP2319934.1 hypothetical protein [Kibdelosporangium banguiense]